MTERVIILHGRRLRPLTFVELAELREQARSGEAWRGRNIVEYQGDFYFDEGPA
jgi:hypothetical protein